MGAVVYASTWGKYHFDRSCPKLRAAQELHDQDCWDDHCTHRHPSPTPVRRMTDLAAALDGKKPCLFCVPQHLRPARSTEDFGHTPQEEYMGSDGREYSREICSRCMIWTHWADVGLWAGHRVAWPCTSAYVLGIVPRKSTP